MTKILTKNFFFKVAILLAIVFLVAFFSPISVEAAVITSTSTGGDWSTTTTWVGGVLPANTDSVIIATTGGNSVTIGAAKTNAGLTVNSGAILSFTGAFTLTENGNLTVNGTVNGATGIIKMNSNPLVMSGSGTINSTITISQPTSIPTGSNLTTTAIITLGNTLTIDSGAILNAVEIDSNAKTVANNGTVNLSGNYFRTGGTSIWTQGTNAVVNIGGEFTPAANITLNATASGNTVNYNGAAQSVEPTTFVNLTLSGSGVKTFPTGTTIVNGVLSMQGTATATVTGTLTPGVASSLEYKGSSTQTTGSEFVSPWPGSGGVKIENASGVTLNAAKSVGANLFTIGGTVAGSIFNDGGFQLTSTGTLNLTSGTFKLGSAGTATTWPSFGTNNITTGTTVEYSAGVAQAVSVTPSYKNLTFSGAGAKTTSAGTVTVVGNWSTAGGTATLSTNNSSVTVTGNISGTGAITSGSGTISLTGDWTNSGTFTKGTGTVTYNGGSTQTVGTLTYNNLIINKAGGSASLGGSGTRVDGVLTLTAGNITTSANDIYISSTGSVSRTSGHIVGNLKKNITTGATSKTFEIGDASNYTPVSLTFGNVTAAGDLTAKTTAGDHPQTSSSNIDSSKSINRYWTLANSGISFNNYGVVLNFINPGDVDGGADTASFIVGLYNAGWTYPTVGTKNSTNTQATGLTGFGDFQLGEANPVDITAPAAVSDLSTSNATNNSIDLSWTAPGDNNSTGTATSYDLRYSTSLITADNFAGATVVTGEPSPSIAGSSESMTVSDLSPSATYYFALKTSDEVPNTSAISNVVSAATTATADIIAPTITSFSIPSTSDSLTVSITSFIATDNVGVSKYLLNESASTPSVSDTGWASTAPTTYIFSSEGSKTLYAWAKDASGNISTSLNAGITITLPITTVISPAQIQDSISGGIIVPNNTLTSSSNVTFTQQVQIDFSTGSTITVPINTVLNAGTNIDFGQLSGTSVVSTSDLSAISATYTVLGAVEFGSGCSSLTASSPVTIKIPADAGYNGQTLTIFKKNSCGINWEQLTTCVASAGFCQFTTTHFTRFALVAIASAIETPPVSTGGSEVPTVVTFSGRAYPNGKIRVYRRSFIENIVRNDYLPNFDIGVNEKGDFAKVFVGLFEFDYLFTLEPFDKNGVSGGIIAFSKTLSSRDRMTIENIFMPPTVTIPNKSITKGNEIKIAGYAYPNSNIELKIDNILRINSAANSSGYYEAIINTSRFSPKTHFLVVRQIDKDGIASNFSASKNFTVSALSYPQADFNGDNIIDIRDWSIFLFRWKANLTLRAFNDLNLDGKVDILDLSIFLKAMRGL